MVSLTMTMNKISLIITTKNEEHNIVNLLDSIEKQTYSNYEIIVVDNNSDDRTKKLAYKYTKNIFNKGPERSVQRNFGVQKSTGKYVFILDADMILQKDVLKECIKEVSNNKSLVGLVVPEQSFGKGFWAKCKAFERSFYLGEDSIEAARFFKKSVFEKFDGYDTEITGPEDYDLPLRIKKTGLKVGRIKSFILHNEKRFSPFKSAKKKFYYASKAKKYLQKHPEMAIKQGNLLLRPIFFKKWKKLLRHPVLTLGMFLVRTIEMVGALMGFAFSD